MLMKIYVEVSWLMVNLSDVIVMGLLEHSMSVLLSRVDWELTVRNLKMVDESFLYVKQRTHFTAMTLEEQTL